MLPLAASQPSTSSPPACACPLSQHHSPAQRPRLPLPTAGYDYKSATDLLPGFAEFAPSGSNVTFIVPEVPESGLTTRQVGPAGQQGEASAAACPCT
jgi:hypothetical protein